MKRSAVQLVDDAVRIWQAGVRAAHPSRLVPEFVHVDRGRLFVADEASATLADVERVVVVGGGKASGAMAAALESAIGVDALRNKRAESCINVPEGDPAAAEILQIRRVRPAGVNEPTEAAAEGVGEMLRLVSGMREADLCFCLVSGGGSALMPAPIEGLTLADKVQLTRELSACGATIHEMNAVRRALSEVKGGGLARACRAGRLISLILSDVSGDDLATIASGPTVLASAGGDAAAILKRFNLHESTAGRRAIQLLASAPRMEQPNCRVTNVLIGNNATAVDGAGVEAERLGYSHAMISAREPEGDVGAVARGLVDMAVRMRSHNGPDCLISGGEPTVRLAPPESRGQGGRNQQLCLEAVALMGNWRDTALLSAGTDGEDGPTKAAGAFVSEQVVDRAAETGSDLKLALARNDAYNYFKSCGGCYITGPTGTNVGDLRVITVARDV